MCTKLIRKIFSFKRNYRLDWHIFLIYSPIQDDGCVRKTNVWYFFTVDATGKKIRGQADGKVNDYDQYGKLTFALICIC